MPILRPLIGMDKIEITEEAQRLGTFENNPGLASMRGPVAAAAAGAARASVYAPWPPGVMVVATSS